MGDIVKNVQYKTVMEQRVFNKPQHDASGSGGIVSIENIVKRALTIVFLDICDFI